MTKKNVVEMLDFYIEVLKIMSAVILVGLAYYMNVIENGSLIIAVIVFLLGIGINKDKVVEHVRNH